MVTKEQEGGHWPWELPHYLQLTWAKDAKLLASSLLSMWNQNLHFCRSMLWSQSTGIFFSVNESVFPWTCFKGGISPNRQSPLLVHLVAVWSCSHLGIYRISGPPPMWLWWEGETFSKKTSMDSLISCIQPLGRLQLPSKQEWTHCRSWQSVQIRLSIHFM